MASAIKRTLLLLLLLVVATSVGGSTALGSALRRRRALREAISTVKVPLAVARGSLTDDYAALNSLKNDAAKQKNSPAIKALFANWTGTNPCKWAPYITCKGGRVVALEITDNALFSPQVIPLNVTLNSQFSDLTQLQLLRIEFYGIPFPSVILKLKTLTELEIHGITSVPDALGSLSNLQSLTMYGALPARATIPTSIGTLPKLTFLYLVNGFTGRVPQQLNSLVHLNFLGIESTSLAGPIWPQIESLTGLTTLYIVANKFTGPIPSSISKKRALQYLFIEYEPGMAGPIPSQIAALPNLKVLDLVAMGLTGTIPAQLPQLKNLTELTLLSNRLQGTLSASFFKWMFALKGSVEIQDNYLNGNTGKVPNNANLRDNCFNMTCKKEVVSQRAVVTCGKIYPALTKACKKAL